MINRLEKEKMEVSLRKKLSKLEIYDAGDKVRIDSDESNKLFVQYKKGNYARLIGTTHFALQIEAETAYLLSIGREERYRNKGFGRILYNVVEDFCNERGVERIQLTFSSEGREEYWQSLGFKKIGWFLQMEKILRNDKNI